MVSGLDDDDNEDDENDHDDDGDGGVGCSNSGGQQPAVWALLQEGSTTRNVQNP